MKECSNNDAAMAKADAITSNSATKARSRLFVWSRVSFSSDVTNECHTCTLWIGSALHIMQAAPDEL